jgi:hypothetical protein
MRAPIVSSPSTSTPKTAQGVRADERRGALDRRLDVLRIDVAAADHHDVLAPAR